MKKVTLINRLLNVLPQGGGIHNGYIMNFLRLLPPEEEDYLLSIGNFFEENGIVCAFDVLYTYNVKKDTLAFEHLRSDTLRADQRNYLEELFIEVAKKYNKLYSRSL